MTEETNLNLNPDVGVFPSDPLAAVIAEKARVDAFRLALVAIPIGDQVPSSLLTPEAAAVTARSTFITATRIPEMDGFLLTTPNYYNSRFEVLRLRVAGSGTLQEINFLTELINVTIPAERADLEAQRELLEALLP